MGGRADDGENVVNMRRKKNKYLSALVIVWVFLKEPMSPSCFHHSSSSSLKGNTRVPQEKALNINIKKKNLYQDTDVVNKYSSSYGQKQVEANYHQAEYIRCSNFLNGT